jgi:hypothetical protein
MTGARITLDVPIFLIDSTVTSNCCLSQVLRYAAGRASRSVSSWMSTAIFVRADECCRL